MKKVYDYGVGVGGPIVRDRLWFYSANRVWGNQGYAANNYFNKSTALVPLRARPGPSRLQRSVLQGLRGARYLAGDSQAQDDVLGELCRRRAPAGWASAGTTAPEAMTSYVYGDTDSPELLTQVGWTFPATNRLLLQAGLSHLKQAVSFQSRGGPGLPDDTAGHRFRAGLQLGRAQTGGHQRPERAAEPGKLQLPAHRLVHHRLALVEARRARCSAAGTIPAATLRLEGSPTHSTAARRRRSRSGRRHSGATRASGASALYASDQWTVKRLTLELRRALRPLQCVHAGRHRPGRSVHRRARSTPASKTCRNSRTSRRAVSAAYDLFGNGKTAIKGSWGRYLLGWGGGAFNFVSPAQLGHHERHTRLERSALRPRRSAERQLRPRLRPRTTAATNGEWARRHPVNFGEPGVGADMGRAMRAPAGASRDYNDQISVNVQHELLPAFGVNVGYYRTTWGNPHVLREWRRDAGRLHAVLRDRAGRCAARRRQRPAGVRSYDLTPAGRAQRARGPYGCALETSMVSRANGPTSTTASMCR